MKKIISALILMLFSVSALYAEKKAPEYIADLNAAKDEKVIIEAADWLAKKEEKAGVPALIKLIEDERVDVRLHVVMALGYIGQEEAVEALNKRLLNDESAEVRYAAVLATVRIGSKKSIDAWKEAKEKESDPFIKDFLKKMEDKVKGK